MEETQTYARSRTVRANSLRKKHAGRWKRRILTGLAALTILGAVGTNRKAYWETGTEEALRTFDKMGIPTWVIGGGKAGLYGSVTFNNQSYSFSVTSSRTSGKTIDTSIAHWTVLDSPTGPGYREVASKSF